MGFGRIGKFVKKKLQQRVKDREDQSGASRGRLIQENWSQEIAGMLERQSLLLRPWQEIAFEHPKSTSPQKERFHWQRLVVDGETSELLGLVKKKPIFSWPFLEGLVPQVFQVFETEDESLLFTLHAPRYIFRPWSIKDAEEKIVAKISSRMIFDGFGEFYAYQEIHSGQKVFLNWAKKELASFHETPEGTLLLFDPLTHDDPFLRMALLGAVLARENR